MARVEVGFWVQVWMERLARFVGRIVEQEFSSNIVGGNLELG